MVLNQLCHHCTLNHSPTHNILSVYFKSLAASRRKQNKKNAKWVSQLFETFRACFELSMETLLRRTASMSQHLYHNRCVLWMVRAMEHNQSIFSSFWTKVFNLYYVNPCKPWWFLRNKCKYNWGGGGRSWIKVAVLLQDHYLHIQSFCSSSLISQCKLYLIPLFSSKMTATELYRLNNLSGLSLIVYVPYVRLIFRRGRQ